jgi:hypothetical protein
MPPLQKTFPLAVLTRAGGEAITTVTPATSQYAGDRWSFTVAAKTDKKGAMKAAIEYGPDSDYQNRMKARRTIEDFSTEDLSVLVCQIVDKHTGQEGSTLWKPPLIRSVTYDVMPRSQEPYSVSILCRQMQLDSRTFAPEPCTAEVIRGRRQSSLLATPASGTDIDAAYVAFIRAVRWEHLLDDDDEDDDR